MLNYYLTFIPYINSVIWPAEPYLNGALKGVMCPGLIQVAVTIDVNRTTWPALLKLVTFAQNCYLEVLIQMVKLLTCIPEVSQLNYRLKRVTLTESFRAAVSY